MKCEEFQILIEDYADGALAEKASSLVNSHIADCAQCSSFYQELCREQQIYARYQRDIETTPLFVVIDRNPNQPGTSRSQP